MMSGMTITAHPDALRAELADLPARIDAAIESGDSAHLAELLVRDRVLERQIETADLAARAQRLADVVDEAARLQAEFDDAARLADRYRVAAHIYERAADDLRTGRLVPLNARLTRLAAERSQLQGLG